MQRNTLFKELMAEYTSQLFPSESEAFKRIAESAADLQWQRNTVAHGYVKGRSFPDKNSPTGHSATFYAVGHLRDGSEAILQLDEPTLEKLMHDVGHLGGNLMAAVVRMGGNLLTDQPELVIADKDLLQGPQSGSFQSLPIAKTPQPPPQS